MIVADFLRNVIEVNSQASASLELSKMGASALPRSV